MHLLNPNDLHAGMAVRFTGEGGYAMQLEKAHELLVPGEVYLVAEVFRDRWGSYIYLDNVQRRSFAISMFADAGNEEVRERKVPAKSRVRKVKAPAAK